MTDTPVPDVRELLARLLHDRGCMDGAECRDSLTTWVTYYNLADAVLAAVSPVIRQQERLAVAAEIRQEIALQSSWLWHRIGESDLTLLAQRIEWSAAAIARSHSTQPEEETAG